MVLVLEAVRQSGPWKVTLTPLKNADAGLNDLISLSIIDILLASPMGFDP